MQDQQRTAEGERQGQERQGPGQEGQLARRGQQGGLARRGTEAFLLSPRDLLTTNPFSLMRRMSEEMDRVLSDLGGGRGEGRIWAPEIEVLERDGNYVIHAALPGLRPDEVKVEVADDVITIQGERRVEQEEERGGIRRSEFRYGQFYRAIPLPEGVKPDQINANFDNGVLEITVPIEQQQQKRQRQIPVQQGSSQQGRSGQQGQQGSSGQQGQQGQTTGNARRP